MNKKPLQKRKLRCVAVLLLASLFLLAGTVFAAEFSAVGTGETRYALMEQERVVLTEEEQAYLTAHPTLVVAADASWRPLEYADENGNYAGVIAEVLARLGEYTGFTIQYSVKDSYMQALQAVQKGEADMISGLAHDEAVAATYNVVLSDPYLRINSAIVSKDHNANLYAGGGQKLAVVAGDYANTAIRAEIAGVELVECENNAACLELVRSEQVDAAIIASYCAEYYMSIPKYSSLHSHTVSDFSWEQGFGVNKNADPLLLSILNKGIEKMAGLDINEAVYQGVVGAAYDNDFMLLIYKHPLLIICIVAGVLAVIILQILSVNAARRKAQLRRIEDGTRLRLALQRTHLCIWEMDVATLEVTQVDNAQERHGFYDLRKNIPQSVIEAGYVHPDDVPLVQEVLHKVKNGEQDVQGCWRIKDLTREDKGSVYWWEQVMFHIVKDAHGRPVTVIGVSEDVTKEKDSQRDALTSVYNRSSFEQMAARVLNERRNAYLQCAFLILDLDGFKQINDTYGHGMGDRVLISVGATLNKTFRATDIVGRLGGDEFTVFMTSISQPEDAELKAKQVVENISSLQVREGFPFPISCSLGVVVAQKGQEELAVLYQKADAALYKAKRAGKNRYGIYGGEALMQPDAGPGQTAEAESSTTANAAK